MYRKNELRARISGVLFSAGNWHPASMEHQVILDELEQLFYDYLSKNHEHWGEADIGSSSLRG